MMIVYIVQGRDTVLYSTVVTYYSVVRTALCVYCTCWIRWGNVTGDRSTAVLISHPESFLKRQITIVDRVWSWVWYALMSSHLVLTWSPSVELYIRSLLQSQKCEQPGFIISSQRLCVYHFERPMLDKIKFESFINCWHSSFKIWAWSFCFDSSNLYYREILNGSSLSPLI